MHDVHPTADLTNKISLLSDSTAGAAIRLADSGSAVPVQNLPDASPVANLDPAASQADTATSSDGSFANSFSPSLEKPRDASRLSHDMTDERSQSTTLTVDASSPPKLSGEIVADAPVAGDSAMLLHGMNEVQAVFEFLSLSGGPAGLRESPSRAADQAVQPSVGNDVSSSMESSPPVVKGYNADMFAASGAGRAEDQALTDVETSLPASGGMANSPAMLTAFSDTSTSNSIEDGLITLDASGAVTHRLGNPSLYNAGFQGVAIASDPGNWLTGALSVTRKPTDSARTNNKAAPSGENLAAGALSSASALVLQPVAESEEGGSIELAMVAAVAARDDSLLAGSSPVAQQLSDIRPESGVGLFCDIEVAASPTLPMGDSASSARTYQNAGTYVTATHVLGVNADAVTKLVLPPARLLQPTLAGLADHLSLLLAPRFWSPGVASGWKKRFPSGIAACVPSKICGSRQAVRKLLE